MTPFQAIKATFYMLLAKAREPIEERDVNEAPTGAVSRVPERSVRANALRRWR